MPLYPGLRDVDRRRTTQLLTAFVSTDEPALAEVLTEVAADPAGATGLVFGLLEYCAWVTAHTTPLPDSDDPWQA
jgi:hypothetical protein